MTRNMTRTERIRARHLLQELAEHALSARNALDPVSGMLAVSYESWSLQWMNLTRELDMFTTSLPGLSAETDDQETSS